MNNDESTPKGAHEIPATVSTLTVQVPAPRVTEADVAADAWFSSAFAILVQGKSIRRHLYRSLAAAERVVKAAHARGDYASMRIVRLVPGTGRTE